MGEAEQDRARNFGRRSREVWGDEPEETDATAVVERIETAFPDTARRWHDHPVFVPFKAVAMFIKRSGKRIAVTVVGGVVLLAGIALLVLPGPGWLLIFIGLGILATEYVWAERLLNTAKKKAVQAKDKVLRKKAAKDDGAAA
jgi:uncharacterized protein (TIGR02611 family)